MQSQWRVPITLMVTWAINDAEEWFTMAPWSAKNARRLERLPVPLPWPKEGMPERQAHAAITVVGVAVAAAAIAGARTKGRSRFYRSSVLAFGLHGLAHLGQAVLMRGYTPGVITAVTTVLPFWAWAERQRRRSGGAPYTAGEKLGAVASIAALVPVVALAGVLTKDR